MGSEGRAERGCDFDAEIEQTTNYTIVVKSFSWLRIGAAMVHDKKGHSIVNNCSKLSSARL